MNQPPPALESTEALLAEAPLESARFGMRVYRKSLAAVSAKTLRAFLLEKQADLAIVRTPGDGQQAATELERLGFPFVHADVLVAYEADLQALTPKPLRNDDLEFVKCTQSSSEALAKLVGVAFSDYRNHYMANPFLPADKALAGFQEWALRYATAESPEQSAWLVRRAGKWVAFATCSATGDGCEGVLYGVHPDHAGGGLYTDLIRFTQRHFKALGLKRMHVSTQVHNLAVQKVWAREGFSLASCHNTWHVMPMLSYSVRALVERELSVEPELIQAYATISGDHNPIHFDDAHAKSLGLPGRIAHGLVANGWLSRVLGMDFPGPGTLFQGYRYLFLRPMLPGSSYKLRLSTLQVDAHGTWKCLAQIRDEEGRPVLLAYLSLAVRGEAGKA